MQRSTPTVIITSLTAVGVVVCALTVSPLLKNTELEIPRNPFGIKRSPYGEICVMALQGPINSNFHMGMYGATEGQMRLKNSQAKQPGNLLLRSTTNEDNGSGEDNTHWSLSNFMVNLLTKLGDGHIERTNPLPPSDLHKFFLRRQAEDKLRFAYDLDPSHYANYNLLHFFLSEGITTRPELASSAGELAEQTIVYCLKQTDDPRPALTAAAACINMIHLLFSEHPDNPDALPAMDQYFKKLDLCLNQYDTIAAEWDHNGGWQRISSKRFDDCQKRHHFILKVREAAEITIQRLKKEAGE